jgi:hypothetical protein
MKKQEKRITSEARLLVGFTFLVLIIAFLFLATQFNLISITGFSVANSYGDYSVYILDAYEGDDVNFIIPIKNTKGSSINNTYAEISVLDSKNNNVFSAITESISILPNETKELKAVWSQGVAGDYQLRTLIFLDDESYSFSKTFKVEKKTITFESIVVDEFKLGEVVNFSIVVQNHLDEELENVSAGILILDDSGNVIEEVRSNKESLDPKSLKKLSANWDTENIKAGTYNAKLNVDYGENFLDKDIVLNINEESIEIAGIGYSIAQQPEESSYTAYIIAFLVVLLILINLSWIILYKRKAKNQEKTNPQVN